MLQDRATIAVITSLSTALRKFIHQHDEIEAESAYPEITSGCKCIGCREGRKALVASIILEKEGS